MDAKTLARFSKRVLMGSVAVAVIGYGCEDLSLRYGIPKGRSTTGQIELEQYYAVPLKNGKTEFFPEGHSSETCVYAIFPHLGYSPCWYLARQKTKRINL